MDDTELRVSDQWEVARVLAHNWDILAIVTTDPASLSGGFVPSGDTKTQDFLRRLEILRQCGSVIRSARQFEYGPFALCDEFRTVLDDVLAGRAIDDFDKQDAEKLAKRYVDWLEVPLHGAWRDAAYLAH